MKIKSIFLFVFFINLASFSQTKVGTIDSELIIGLMPETKIVLTNLSKYAQRLDSPYQIRVKDYQDKINAFQKLDKDVSDAFKKIKADEIKEIEKDLGTSQNTGNKLIQLKRDELMRPLYKKLRGVIAEISKANGYTQILTTTGNEFAYVDEKYDITKLAMAKLGIKIPEEK